MGRLASDAKCEGRLEDELAALGRIPLPIVDEVGCIPFDPPATDLMFALVSSGYERASMTITSNKPFARRDLRRRRHRRRDGRPARAPR
jgi:DNA replication protein DnaC